MKKKILFILPSLGTGGIVSSFTALFNEIYQKYDILILLSTSNRNDSISFSSHIIKDFLLLSYNSPFRNLGFLQRILSLILLPYKRFFLRGKKFPVLIAKNVSKRLMNKYHFDIVVGFSEGLPTFLASTFERAIKICWIHCDYKRYYEQRCKTKDEFSVYNKMNRIILVSEFTRNNFLSIYPALKSRTNCIYNLLDINHIRQLSVLPIDDNRFKTDHFTIISVGRLDPVKRFSMVPTIAKQLKCNGVSFRWYIIGPDINNESDILSKEIIDKGVEKEVIWLGGKKNPYSYMLKSDLYVCLSSSEACPMVFNEAKVLRLPIVSSVFGSVNEFLQDGQNGFITSLDHIGNKILLLINNNELLAGIRDNIMKAPYHNDIIISRIYSLFDQP